MCVLVCLLAHTQASVLETLVKQMELFACGVKSLTDMTAAVCWYFITMVDMLTENT